MTTLTGTQIDELSKDLSRAMNLSTLQRAVYSSTGDQLFVEYVGEGRPLRPTIEQLLLVLEEQGTTQSFLSYIHQNWHNNSNIRAAIQEKMPEAAISDIGTIAALSVQNAGQPQQDAPKNSNAPGFQRNVRPNLQKINVREWYQKYLEIEARVCRIEIDGAALGTGFLVGPQAVLTNWHVIEGAKAGNRLDRIGCRFDYVRLPTGARQEGTTVLLANDGGDQGLADFSPYGKNEKNNIHQPPPATNELDYALLRLERSIGTEADRGWITLPNTGSPPDKGAAMQIVQHPDGAAMMLAIDTDAIIGTNDNDTRIQYTTNTEPGSSGSPCMTMDWELFALHHYGDPVWGAPTFNQGIPTWLVRDLISQRPGLGLLGD